MMLITATGCAPPPIEHKAADDQSISRGELAARELGCAVCHDIPNIKWPKGRVGPQLHGFGKQALIAGTLPNTPNHLADFLYQPQALVPQTSMPAIPMTRAQAKDMAAWLHSFRGEAT